MFDMQSVSDGLSLGEDGIWYGLEDQETLYPSEKHEGCFAIENKSFWFGHRNNCIISIVNSYPPQNNETIFDIGGGNGFVSMGLNNAGFDMVLVEPGKVGAFQAKQRGVENVICATTDTAKFKKNSLPAVGIFDVIEHIEDDMAFLYSISTLTKKNGRLYITVPSYSFLWSASDVAAGHFRRYTINNICQKLKSAGFEIEYASYFFQFLPLPVWFFRSLPYKIGLKKNVTKPKRTSKSQKTSESQKKNAHIIQYRLVLKILDFIMKREIKNLKGKKAMSFGSSCAIVARKT